MRSKKFVIVYAIILFVIIFLIAFNSICAIKQVDVKFDVSSQVAKERSIEIQKEMDGFLKKNYLFFKTGDVEKIFDREEYTHFKLLSVEKKFPNKIIVKVKEMYEYYAFYDSANQEYLVTDENGEVIAIKSNVSNNISGNNVAVNGFSISPTNVHGTVSVADEEAAYFNGVKAALSYFDSALGGVRTNIVSVTFDSVKETALFQSQEGVQFYFTNISKYSDELFSKVCDKYQNGLSDVEKTYGRIAAFVKDDGTCDVQYVSNSTPQ